MNLGKNLRHAYAIEGDSEVIRRKLWDIFESDYKIKIKANPDFFYRKYEIVGIDDSRFIKDQVGHKKFSSEGKKIFVIEADGMTVEAQNSLLKILEEPAENTHFFIIGNIANHLIPTLVSRMTRVRAEDEISIKPGEFTNYAEKFIKASVTERMEMVKKFSEEIKAEKRDKSDALALVKKVEQILYENARNKGELPSKYFEQLIKCEDYLSDRSAGVKMLLEYVTLVIPKF